MEKKQFENNNFVLYSPDTLNYITYDMEDILSESLESYKKLFDVDLFRKVQINYFDDLNKFREFVKEIRGEEIIPEYVKGTFDKGMINAYIETNLLKDSPLYNRKKRNASHELFHIMYQELVWEKNNMNRITWFDEGMAEFFSGEFESAFSSDSNYETFINNVISNTKVIPNLNDISHGTSFVNENYNGYRLSLLAVKYLYDKLGLDEFKKLLKDENKIIEYGNTVLKEIFNNYKNK